MQQKAFFVIAKASFSVLCSTLFPIYVFMSICLATQPYRLGG